MWMRATTTCTGLEEEFRLPMSHRPMENVDTEGLEQASVDTRLTSSNVGFRLLQKMGWKGKGLGKNQHVNTFWSCRREGAGKFAQLAHAQRKLQQHKQEQPEISAEHVTSKNLPAPGNQNQRQTLKFGFFRMAPSKAPVGNINKKPKVATKVSSVFGNDSDEES